MTPKPTPFEVVVLYKTLRIFVYFSWLTLNWIYAIAYENDYMTFKKKQTLTSTEILICWYAYREVNLTKPWILVPNQRTWIKFLIKEMLEKKYFWQSNVNIKAIAAYYLAVSKRIRTQPLQSLSYLFYDLFWQSYTNHWIFPFAFSSLSVWLIRLKVMFTMWK